MIFNDETAKAVLELLKELKQSAERGNEVLADFEGPAGCKQAVANFEDEIKQNEARFAVVRLDQTALWSVDKPENGRIYGVYLVDLNEMTHCCELTPSYTLYFLYNTCTLHFDEEVSELIESTTEDESIMYVHCSSIDALTVQGDVAALPGGDIYYTKGKTINDLTDLAVNYDRLVEDMIEVYQGNHAF